MSAAANVVGAGLAAPVGAGAREARGSVASYMSNSLSGAASHQILDASEKPVGKQQQDEDQHAERGDILETGAEQNDGQRLGQPEQQSAGQRAAGVAETTDDRGDEAADTEWRADAVSGVLGW